MNKKRLAQILRMAGQRLGDIPGNGACGTLMNLNLSGAITSEESRRAMQFLYKYFANPTLNSCESFWLNKRRCTDLDGWRYRKQLLLDAADFVEVTGIVE